MKAVVIYNRKGEQVTVRSVIHAAEELDVSVTTVRRRIRDGNVIMAYGNPVHVRYREARDDMAY